MGVTDVTVMDVDCVFSGKDQGETISLLDRSEMTVAFVLFVSIVGHVERAVARLRAVTLKLAAVRDRTFFAPGTVTLNEAAVGDRTVLAPGIVMLKDAAVGDSTVFAPGIVTRKLAAVSDCTRFVPRTVTFAKKDAVVPDTTL